jgi:hypothetical protein
MWCGPYVGYVQDFAEALLRAVEPALISCRYPNLGWEARPAPGQAVGRPADWGFDAISTARTR